MSLGKQKNLIIVGAVVAALLAAGVLVAGYADVLPGRAKTDEQVKPCPSGEAEMTCAAKADAAECPQVVAATEAAPAESCCSAEKPADGCVEPAAVCEKPAAGCGEPTGSSGDCEKPAAGCEKPAGGCEDAAGGSDGCGESASAKSCSVSESPKGSCEEHKSAEAAGGCSAAKADAATE